MLNKLLSFKMPVIISAALIASLGTMPYGFKFAQTLPLHDHFLSLLIGIIFALSAALANMALSIHSFLYINLNQQVTYPVVLIIASILSAIPNGFICYFAYQHILSAPINFTMSCAVIMINTIIAYTALLHFALKIKSKKIKQLDFYELLFRIIGLLIGIAVSTTIYMAAFYGTFNLLLLSKINHHLIFSLTFIIALITWLPIAALYGNATQVVAGRLYLFLRQFSHHRKTISRFDIFILLFAGCSGISFMQITIDFFNPVLGMASLKSAAINYFIQYILIPLAFVSSAAVNYLAIKNILPLPKQKNT